MTKRLTRMGLLTALALIIFSIEAQIPPPVPIPGVKLGLSNIITVYAMFCLGPKDTLLILLVRIFLGSIFTGQMMALAFSFCGGMLCYLVMLLMRHIVTENQIWVCSVVGAIAHNAGQIIAAIITTNTPGLVVYLPILLISGIAAGLFTGLVAQFTIHRMKKIQH